MRFADNATDEPILDCLVCGQPTVALRIPFDVRVASAGSFRDGLPNSASQFDDLFQFDFDVADLAPDASARFVDHEPSVWQAQPPVAFDRKVQMNTRACHPTRTDGVHRRANESNHVVDCVRRLDMAAG